MYSEGAHHSTTLRCQRHLHAACEICIQVRQPARAPGCSVRNRSIPAQPSIIPPQGLTGWLDGSGIGTGLAQPGINGSVLRRKSKWTVLDPSDDTHSTAGNRQLLELIPHFLRLSALVAIELARELGDDDCSTSSEDVCDDITSMPTPTSPSTRCSHMDMQTAPLSPSYDWYMLLVGLLTRAALEGYLINGWRGPDGAGCLFSVGNGLNHQVQLSEDDDLGDPAFDWFDPDDLPGLKDASRVLFPSLRGGMPNGAGLLRRDNPEAAFRAEMEARLRRVSPVRVPAFLLLSHITGLSVQFLDIPQQTPDLSTHMEDLAWHYPAEPVERAALRFCEAVSKWRGKPELETVR